MSYTLYITSRSKDLAARMNTFLLANYRPWSEVARKSPNEAPPSDFMTRPELETSITFGIWYSACEPQRDYAWTLAYWIALKIGRKIPFKSLGFRFLYVSYDHYEAVPIIPPEFVRPDRTEGLWKYASIRDSLGCQYKDDVLDIHRRATLPKWQAEIDHGRKLISEEIKRLEDLWIKEQ